MTIKETDVPDANVQTFNVCAAHRPVANPDLDFPEPLLPLPCQKKNPWMKVHMYKKWHNVVPQKYWKRPALSHWQKIPSRQRLRGRNGRYFVNGRRKRIRSKWRGQRLQFMGKMTEEAVEGEQTKRILLAVTCLLCDTFWTLQFKTFVSVEG
jgi:hypothetical protein